MMFRTYVGCLDWNDNWYGGPNGYTCYHDLQDQLGSRGTYNKHMDSIYKLHC